MRVPITGFLLRVGVALILSALVGLAYAMLHGIPLNQAYQSAVDREIELSISSGRVLGPDGVEQVQEKYKYLSEGPMDGPRASRVATHETLMLTLLIWVAALSGQVRQWGAVAVVAFVLMFLQMQLQLIDGFVSVIWLMAVVFSTTAAKEERAGE